MTRTSRCDLGWMATAGQWRIRSAKSDFPIVIVFESPVSLSVSSTVTQA